MDEHNQSNGERVLIDLDEAPPSRSGKEATSTDLNSAPVIDFDGGAKKQNEQRVPSSADIKESNREEEINPFGNPEISPSHATTDNLGTEFPNSKSFVENGLDLKSDHEQSNEQSTEQPKPDDNVTSVPCAPVPSSSTGAPSSPVKSKPPASSPTKVPKLIATNGDKTVGRPKSGTAKVKAATPTAPHVISGIPGCQRAVSVDRTKSSLSSPRTPSSTPVGILELTRFKSPVDDCGGSTASTPRSSASHRGSDSVRSQAKSKIGSLENAKHVTGGGNVSIMSHKIDLSQVTSKCGSKDNIKHTPKGGDKKVETRKLEWKAESKIGSLNNARHKPGGGDKKIETSKLEWKATSKVGSMENAQHVPGGGTKKIESLKLDFKEKAQPKIGSKDNIGHKPGGGTKKIESQKLDFKEAAQPRIDASLKTSVEITEDEEVHDE